MKKIFFGIMFSGILILASCTKTSVNSGLHITQLGGGTWTFAGITDSATSCLYDTGTGTYAAMTASNYTSGNFTNYTTIRCGYTEKLVAGTYTVVPTTVNPTGNQLNFEIDYGLGGTNGNSWYSSGTGTNQTVNVAISGNKISITGSGITLYQVPLSGNPNSSDTTTLSLNLYANY